MLISHPNGQKVPINGLFDTCHLLPPPASVETVLSSKLGSKTFRPSASRQESAAHAQSIAKTIFEHEQYLQDTYMGRLQGSGRLNYFPDPDATSASLTIRETLIAVGTPARLSTDHGGRLLLISSPSQIGPKVFRLNFN